MKKLNLLMLLALTLLMFGCRTELSSEETSLTQSDFRKTIKLKEALAFKNYLIEIKNNPSNSYSKNEDFFSSLSDDATVTVITQNNVTSYSTVVRHLDRSSDVLVYSVDNENKSIGFIAKYKPADLTKNYQIDNFTGTVEYTTIDGRPMGTKELSNGTPLPDKGTGTKTTANKVNCSLSIRLIEVECNGEHHTPSQYAQCTANEKPYYIVEITEVCPSGGQPPKGFPNMGMYDGGGDTGGSTTSNEMSIQDSFNYMLSESGFAELSVDEYTYIQNNQYIGGQLLSYFYNNLSQNKNLQLLHWSIDYLKILTNPNISQNTTWNQFETTLNFAQQFFVNNPNSSWENFLYNKHSNEPNSSIDVENNVSGNYDENTYANFDFENQQTQWPTINNVIPVTDFIGWNAPGIRRNCMDYAKAQIAKKGYKISNYYDVDSQGNKQTFQIYTEQDGVNLNDLYKGVSYLKYALSKGIPVIVGIDDAAGHPGNLDKSTDHFVVIVGMGTDSNGNFFRFYDNASGIDPINQGANSENKLYYKYPQRIFTGKTNCTAYRAGTEHDYIVTMIRKSK
ncbi:hypothetical protein REB14_20985 [Chryseobacterium sp. ES2]|uniref:Peptidase C39-like domain-containing protein n=1 Tax=Chryseobacterium metallicongregator TaxID=3073042 RepID=A0ABU1EA11_9FLAO|nr:hypothetical protein [Chryseobacterium sp. ES2]MDR4954664.1 hypothetical protein [Chryseobacterium sp. ES2]